MNLARQNQEHQTRMWFAHAWGKNPMWVDRAGGIGREELRAPPRREGGRSAHFLFADLIPTNRLFRKLSRTRSFFSLESQSGRRE